MSTTIIRAEVMIDEGRLGLDNTLYSMEQRQDVCTVTDILAREARLGLLLFTEDLEPDIFSRESFLESASALARRHPDSYLKIILRNGRKTVSRGHRLIELAERLSSHIQVRRPAIYHRDRHRTFLVADGTGYFDRPLSSRYEGTANFNDPAEAEVLTKEFMEIWGHATPDRELTRLFL